MVFGHSPDDNKMRICLPSGAKTTLLGAARATIGCRWGLISHCWWLEGRSTGSRLSVTSAFFFLVFFSCKKEI